MKTEAKKLKQFAAVTLGCLIADQLTKQVVLQQLSLGEHRNLIPGVHITRSYNQGIAFSLFANHSWLVTSLLAFCMLAVVVFLALCLQNQPANVKLGRGNCWWCTWQSRRQIFASRCH